MSYIFSRSEIASQFDVGEIARRKDGTQEPDQEYVSALRSEFLQRIVLGSIYRSRVWKGCLSYLRHKSESGSSFVMWRPSALLNALPELLDLRIPELGGMTFLHLAARDGWIRQVPQHLLTPSRLMMREDGYSRGDTVLHDVAFHGHLGMLKAEYLTDEMMNMRNGSYETPAHLAYRNGFGNSIPWRFMYLVGLDQRRNA